MKFNGCKKCQEKNGLQQRAIFSLTNFYLKMVDTIASSPGECGLRFKIDQTALRDNVMRFYLRVRSMKDEWLKWLVGD